MPDAKYGTIFIVDISGYSNFVKEIPTEEGAMIMPGLLNAIIKANKLSLKVAEIEGDAVLFYRMGSAYSINSILFQFKVMLKAFNREKEFLTSYYPSIENLTIKLIVHYGMLSGFEVGGFYKLYGKVLVEAHRLLKNHIVENTYTLITEQYFQQQKHHVHQEGTLNCERYDVGNLCYTYFPFGHLKFIPQVA